MIRKDVSLGVRPLNRSWIKLLVNTGSQILSPNLSTSTLRFWTSGVVQIWVQPSELLNEHFISSR